MSRHIIDHPRLAGPARLLHFLRLAREERPVPVKVTQTPPGPRGLTHFLRIARGRTT